MSRYVSYNPQLAIHLGDPIAAILLQRIAFWYERMNGQPFFKFTEQNDHPLYKHGDSWCEELGITRNQFRSARKKIAQAKNSKGEKPVIYWRDRQNRYWYVLIPHRYNDLIDCLSVEGVSREIQKVNVAEYEKRISRNAESECRYNIEDFNKDINNRLQEQQHDDVEYLREGDEELRDGKNDKPTTGEAYDLLRSIRVDERMALSLAKKHDTPLIRRVVDYARDNASNTAGFAVSALRDGYQFDDDWKHDTRSNYEKYSVEDDGHSGLQHAELINGDVEHVADEYAGEWDTFVFQCELQLSATQRRVLSRLRYAGTSQSDNTTTVAVVNQYDMIEGKLFTLLNRMWTRLSNVDSTLKFVEYDHARN